MFLVLGSCQIRWFQNWEKKPLRLQRTQPILSLRGNSSRVEHQLVSVRAIQASSGAFAAIKYDGSVVTWGYRIYGGDSSAVQENLIQVQEIQSTSALKGDLIRSWIRGCSALSVCVPSSVRLSDTVVFTVLYRWFDISSKVCPLTVWLHSAYSRVSEQVVLCYSGTMHQHPIWQVKEL